MNGERDLYPPEGEGKNQRKVQKKGRKKNEIVKKEKKGKKKETQELSGGKASQRLTN